MSEKKLQLKAEDLAEPLHEHLDPILAEPVPDIWLEAFVRQINGEPDEEKPPCRSKRNYGK